MKKTCKDLVQVQNLHRYSLSLKNQFKEISIGHTLSDKSITAFVICYDDVIDGQITIL